MRWSRIFGAFACACACACGVPAKRFRAPKALVEGPPVRAFVVRSRSTGSAIAERPPPSPPFQPRTVRDFVERRLSGGVRLIAVPQHEFPSATVLLILDRGAAAAPPGVAGLYAGAMLGDSDAYDGDEAFEYFRYVGATVTAFASDDAVVLRVTALAPFLRSALSRAVPMFVTPKLASDDVDRARTRFSHLGPDGDAGTIARRALASALFSDPHPYGRPASLVTASDVAGITRDALVSFRDTFLSTERVHVVAIGDVDPSALVRALEHDLAPLPRRRTGRETAALPTSAPCAGRIRLVDRPGASQSWIAVGWPWTGSAAAELPALDALAAAAGGGLSSRLDLTIRSELGATYGVRARVEARRHGGAFEISAPVDTARTVVALEGILRETERLRTEPLGVEELKVVKERAIHDLDRSPYALADALARFTASGRSAAEFSAYGTRLATLTAEDVRAAAERFWTASRRCVVVVGDARRIAAPLSELGIGAVEPLDAR